MSGYQEFRRDLRFLIVFALVFSVIHSCGGFGTDDTDGTKRSGIALRTDYGTGCQYLEGSLGGLTPRLDTNGQQICEK